MSLSQNPGPHPQPPYPPYAPPPPIQQASDSTPTPFGPRIQEAIAKLDLLPGEQVVYAIQADGFFIGFNPILKVIAALKALVTTLTGGHIRIFLIISNQRVMVVRSIQHFCGFQRVRGVHAVALSGIKEAGSTKDTQFCCIHSRILTIQSMTQMWNLPVKKLTDGDLRSFVTNMSQVIVAHSTRAGV